VGGGAEDFLLLGGLGHLGGFDDLGRQRAVGAADPERAAARLARVAHDGAHPQGAVEAGHEPFPAAFVVGGLVVDGREGGPKEVESAGREELRLLEDPVVVWAG
jgi:hypothetical protein